MTLLGKIFTVLIFLISTMFLAMSLMVFATHRNWKEAVVGPNGLQTQLAAVQTRESNLQDSMQKVQDQLNEERAARRQALAALQSKLIDLQQQVNVKESQLGTATAENSQLVKELETAQALLIATTKEVETLRGELVVAKEDRDEKFNVVVSLNDQKHNAEGEARRLAERNSQLALDVADQRQALDSAGIDPAKGFDDRPPRGLDARVDEVLNNLVEISIGSDDGLRVGHQLDIIRGSNYLGRITIRQLEPNRAVGEIDPNLRRGEVQKGDRVTTNLG
jgi:hypothetical protein